MHLKPTLGPVQLIFYSVGVIVGAGIYSVIGTAAALAQDGLWISFLIGAAVAFLTAVSYAEMTILFPAAGAEYVYVRRAVPNADWAAFGIGLCDPHRRCRDRDNRGDVVRGISGSIRGVPRLCPLSSCLSPVPRSTSGDCAS